MVIYTHVNIYAPCSVLGSGYSKKKISGEEQKRNLQVKIFVDIKIYMSKLNGIYKLFKKVHCNDIITCVFINRWIFQVTQIVTYMLK